MVSWLRRVYDFGNTPVKFSENHHYHLEAAPKLSCCARLTHNVVWVATRPFVWADAFYNAVQLARKKELSVPILQTIKKDSPITPYPFPNMMLYIVQQGMTAFLKAPRHDSDLTTGFFEDKTNHEVFLPILSDIVAECDRAHGRKNQVTRNDFLFTCGPDQALRYRSIILRVMGPQNQKMIRESLDTIADEIIKTIPNDGRVENANDFCGEFTTTVISKLFLNHPGPGDKYRQIHWAITQLDKLAMQKRWGKLSPEANANYQRAIRMMSEAIETAANSDPSGFFVNCMRQEDFTDTQIKGMLFLVFLAGSGTTTTAVKYLLWQLGRHPEHQDAIHGADEDEKKQLISKAISEALRLAPPVGIMGRFALRDLTFKITEKGRTVYSYTIPKGAGVLASPLVTARNLDPREGYDPSRVENGESLPWQPFSSGFHGCPGKALALAELSILVSRLLAQFTITSYPVQEDLKRHQFMTLCHPENVSFQFTQR